MCETLHLTFCVHVSVKATFPTWRFKISICEGKVDQKRFKALKFHKKLGRVAGPCDICQLLSEKRTPICTMRVLACLAQIGSSFPLAYPKEAVFERGDSLTALDYGLDFCRLLMLAKHYREKQPLALEIEHCFRSGTNNDNKLKDKAPLSYMAS